MPKPVLAWNNPADIYFSPTGRRPITSRSSATLPITGAGMRYSTDFKAFRRQNIRAASVRSGPQL